MLFGGALVAEPGHTLLSARAFSYVSAGFGFGGSGAGAARKQCAGHNKTGDEKDEETKPKCHESHCHLGTRVDFFSMRFSVARLSDRVLSDLPCPLHRPEKRVATGLKRSKDRRSTFAAKI